jgi:hypothetical protein
MATAFFEKTSKKDYLLANNLFCNDLKRRVTSLS